MIKLRDLLFLNMDIRGQDEVSLVVDGSCPEKMFAKSAQIIYGNYSVLWFCGTMFGISEHDEFAV